MSGKRPAYSEADKARILAIAKAFYPDGGYAELERAMARVNLPWRPYTVRALVREAKIRKNVAANVARGIEAMRAANAERKVARALREMAKEGEGEKDLTGFENLSGLPPAPPPPPLTPFERAQQEIHRLAISRPWGPATKPGPWIWGARIGEVCRG